MPNESKKLCSSLLRGYPLLCLSLIAAPPALAQDEDEEAAGLWERDTLTGDWGGLRSALEDRGISFETTETLDIQGNAAGGLRRGGTLMGKGEAKLTFDLEKLVEWPGAKVVVSAYQIHGRGLSANYVGNLLTVSSVEAAASTRLANVYLEQSLFDDALNIRIGQFLADEEFLTSDIAGVFVNSTFGWPGIFGIDLPGGGPAYPFATPGIRVRYTANDWLAVQGAVFNGNVLGSNGDKGGVEFPLDGVFAIAEVAISTMPDKNEPGLGGNFKFGGWYNSLHFEDLRYDITGLSLADPGTTGVARSHRGNFGLYAMMDHQLYRTPDTEDGGLSGFLRVATVPRQDRSPVYVYLDAGLTWKGTFPDRDDDVFGVAFAWANLSNALRGLDRDTILFSGTALPVRSSEMVLEVTYQAQVTPWLVLQPDFQYIIRPGGNAPNPNDPTVPLKNAVVLGLRSVIKF